MDDYGLHFESDLDNEKLKQAIDETLKRIEGLSTAAASGGKKMDESFNATAETIDKTFREIDNLTDTHTNAIVQLQDEYEQLNREAAAAFKIGDDKSYVNTKKKADAIHGEIIVRKKLKQELAESADALAKEEQKLVETEEKTKRAAEAQVNFRTRLRELREELIKMEMDGLRGTDAYRKIQEEASKLTDAIGDARAQANILAHDQATSQGIISGLTGIAGAFSVATGSMALFTGESEELQKIMLKVQSVMSITIGLQQVQQTLNKDSEFMLVTIGNLKKWWAGVVAKATVAETANTVATTANTAAKNGNNVATSKSVALTTSKTGADIASTAATKTNTLANMSLAGSFRIVGAAIKSIPVVGWVAAGIAALLAVVRSFGSEARKAAKEQDELNSKIADIAFEPLGAIERLSFAYSKLGSNLAEKKKFITQNKEEFDKLGISVTSVIDAENALINNKDKFIDAQIAKAKSMMLSEKMADDFKKLAVLKQQYEQAEDVDKSVYIQTSSMGTGTYSTVNEKKKKEKELNEFKDSVKKQLEEINDASNEYAELMKETGIKSTNDIVENSLKAYRVQLQAKQELLDKVTSKDEYDTIAKEMEAIQKKIVSITGDTVKVKDPFIDQLGKKKEAYAEYAKWMSSTDKGIREAAQVEFSELLKDGKTYIDYLESRRAQLEGIAERTAAQEAKLRAIYSQIASETNSMAIDDFNNALKKQLDAADNVLAKLDLIKQKREELDDSDPSSAEKGKSLDKAEEDVSKELKSNISDLLNEYIDYTDKKIQIDKQYFDDLAALEYAYSQASTEEEKARILRSIEARKQAYADDSKTSGDADYDSMLDAYATFEDKKQSIIDDFDNKRKIALKHGNDEMIKELDAAQAKALSSLALDEMVDNPDWSKLFGDLDTVATSELSRIMKWIESQTATLGIKFDPKDLEAIQNAVGKAKSEIQKRNPFKALIDGVKEYKNAEDDVAKKQSLNDLFKSAGAAADMLNQTLSVVTSGLGDMGISISESTQEILDGIGGMMDGASTLAKGLASKNPVDILQGSIGIITSAMDVFDSRSRRQERRIKKHAKALKELENAYRDLEKAASQALGSDKYEQSGTIENLKKQNQELNGMIDAEGRKKKRKRSKKRMEEWEEAIRENKEKMAELIDELRDQLIGIDAPDIASQLGNAMIQAFASGEDAAQAWGDKVDDIVSNIARRILIEKTLEKPMGDMLDRYSRRWIRDDGTFIGFDTVMGDLPKLATDLNKFSDEFSKALDGIPDDIKEFIFGGLEDADMSLTGAVKGISEEQASMLGGQTNAIRVNQIESQIILRDILMNMALIAGNTSYNKHLEGIDNKLATLTSKPDTLRASGLN